MSRTLVACVVGGALAVGSPRAGTNRVTEVESRQQAAASIGKSSSLAEIGGFLWSILETEVARSMYERTRGSGLPANPYTVGDAAWVDVDRDGVPDLVATLSTSPRLIFNQLVLVRRVSGEIKVDRVGVADLEKLGGVLRDLDGDGKLEFVVPSEYSAGSGQNRVKWTSVLELAPDGFIDASEHFPQVYLGEIARTRDEITTLALRAGQVPTPLLEEQLAGREMVLDRLLAVTGQDIDAPTRRAEGWVSSRNPALRGFAVDVFATFPDPRASAGLRLLSKDSDAVVRGRAEVALSAPSR